MFSALTSPGTVLLLALALLMFKHFLADYPLQTKFQMRKTAKKLWLWPLLQHCIFHGVLTFAVLFPLISFWQAALLGLCDFAAHFCIDLWKARSKQHHAFKKEFWTKFGADQLFHNWTYIFIALAAARFSAS